MTQQDSASSVRTAVEIAVTLLLLFAVIAWCFEIIRPFVTVVLWAAIIAIACHTPYQKLRRWLGGSGKWASTVFALVGLAIIILPALLFAESLVASLGQLRSALESGDVNIPPPNERVKDWPLVGANLYENWASAAANLSTWMEEHADQIKPIVAGLFGKVIGLGVTLLQFIASVLIAAVLLAKAESLGHGIGRIARRLSAANGEEMLDLSTATVRSVAVGVLGVAFIQAVAGGAGMVLMGVPAAGVWALVILILAIAQLPPLIVLLPAIIYVFSTSDAMLPNILFAVWSVLVSISDSFLKPLLLGRGVKAPMLVILLGAIGGMIQYGMIGLFLGAIVLALGYILFEAWLTERDEPPAPDESPIHAGKA